MSVYRIYNEKTFYPVELGIKEIKETYNFYFKSEKSNLKYVVEATYHEENFYAIKFYAKTHANSKRRYSLSTNTYEPFRIIHTCMQVLPRLLKLHNGASFVAIGSRTMTIERIENIENTVRFRMYRRYLGYTIINGFVVSYSSENSGIALINVNDMDLESVEDQTKQKIQG